MRNKFYFLLIISILFLTLVSTAKAATFIVDRADDLAGATACTAAANDCSLRGAIINANANGTSADTIQFNVNGGNAQSITMSSTPLPDIQTSLTIDGTTQPLFGGLPLIQINGAASIINTNGFKITSPANGSALTVTIKSLIINRFKGSGIYFDASSGVTSEVVGCYIGTNPGGTIAQGNGNNGIRITAYPDSAFNIGSTQLSERNVISANQTNGIEVSLADNVFANQNTSFTILNNFIGVSAAGNADLGNTQNGIRITGGSLASGYQFQIGNGFSTGRNIISGNDKNGIAATSGNFTIYGNFIGASFNGNAAIGNTSSGIELFYNADATIGGTVLGFNAGNVISGNGQHGIEKTSASVTVAVRRNLIGTNAAGNAELGNSSNVIYLNESNDFTDSSIIIGSDTNASEGNVISGNGGDGIEISEKIRKVKVFGNKMGTNETATMKIPNRLVGIRIGSAQNEIGLAGNDTASNVISGMGNGVF